MKKTLLSILLTTTAIGAAAFSDSGRFVHRGCGGYNPVITVSPSCTYQTGTCSISWVSEGNFYMNNLIIKEEGSYWNNLVPANSDAVPQSGSYCTTGDGHYCYRLQLTNVAHTDLGTNGVLTEILPPFYEQADNLVELISTGGVNFGLGLDTVTFKVAQSNTGRGIAHIAYQCNDSDHTEFHDVEFQIQFTGWFPHV